MARGTNIGDRRRPQPAPRARIGRRARAGAPKTALHLSAARRRLADVYDADHVSARGGSGRWRWVLSTCLAGLVGALSIAVVIIGSMDGHETAPTSMPTIREVLDGVAPESAPRPKQADGLRWAVPRVDRMLTGSGAPTARHVIHEQVQGKRDNRPFLWIRPYLRVTARLTPVPAANADVIPPFNPIRLYGASEGSPEAEGEASATENKHVAVQVVELLGGILPGEDGQAIDEGEALSIAERALEAEAPVADLKPTLQREGGAGPSLTPQNLRAGRATDAPREPVAPNTTILAKTTTDDSDLDDAPERNEVRVVRAGRGDTLVKILQRLGADLWTARAMVDAGKSVFPESQLGSGHEVHVTLVPSLQKPDTREPARFSVFSDGHLHKLTVSRNAAGEFVASAQMPASSLALAALGDSDQAQTSSLYGALYNAALSQAVPPEKIMQVLRTHAYETDFRRRVGLTDALELFFDVRDEPGSEPTPGELLFTALTVGGETQRYWRFRSSDGVVDYYDEFGNNSRKFLMRRPIRGEEVRFTSGYGIRFHPLLNERRMHTGVDWSAPIGTPILAAGNGVVEEADRKGQYGNYIRIRHANGYQTSYAHMSRFAPGIQEGVKVRQGQVIGFVGNTGLSSGPHLHYEVLVSNRYVDPMQIQVPRERRLTGRQAAEFQRERSRIDELMRRPPVMTITR